MWTAPGTCPRSYSRRVRTSTTTGAMPALIAVSSASGSTRAGVAVVAQAVIPRATSTHAADIDRAPRLIARRRTRPSLVVRGGVAELGALRLVVVDPEYGLPVPEHGGEPLHRRQRLIAIGVHRR